MTMVPSAPTMASSTEEGEIEMQSLVTIKDVNGFMIVNKKKKSIGSGVFTVGLIDENSLLLFIPGVFHYAINKQFPSLRASEFSFVFPGKNGVCFGLVFPFSTPKSDMQLFEGLLTQHSQFSVATEEVDVKAEGDQKTELTRDEKIIKTGKAVAAYIKKGTVLAQIGIRKGTKIAAKGISRTQNAIKRNIKTRHKRTVSANTMKKIETVKSASNAALSVSKAVVLGAQVVCQEIAESLSNAASDTKIGRKIRETKNPKVQAAKEIGKETVIGMITILDELRDAAIVLIGEVADASADVAHFKYGDEVGAAAHSSADAVKNIAHVGRNVTQLAPKHLVVRTGAVAAVDLVSTDEEKARHRKEVREQQTNDPSAQQAQGMAMVASALIASQKINSNANSNSNSNQPT